MTLQPDITIFIQAFLFFLVFLFLNRFVFSSLLVTIDERRKKSIHAMEAAKKMIQEATHLQELYHSQFQTIKDNIRNQKETVRFEFETDKQTKIETSRQELFSIFEQTKKQLKIEAASVKEALVAETEAITSEIIEKFSGKLTS